MSDNAVQESQGEVYDGVLKIDDRDKINVTDFRLAITMGSHTAKDGLGVDQPYDTCDSAPSQSTMCQREPLSNRAIQAPMAFPTSRTSDLTIRVPQTTSPVHSSLATRFELFPKLPLELKEFIWEMAGFFDPRVITMKMVLSVSTPSGGKKCWRQYSYRVETDTPAILLVNRDSYTIGLRRYQEPFKSFLNHRRNQDRVYFNFAVDVLHLANLDSIFFDSRNHRYLGANVPNMVNGVWQCTCKEDSFNLFFQSVKDNLRHVIMESPWSSIYNGSNMAKLSGLQTLTQILMPVFHLGEYFGYSTQEEEEEYHRSLLQGVIEKFAVERGSGAELPKLYLRAAERDRVLTLYGRRLPIRQKKDVAINPGAKYWPPLAGDQVFRKQAKNEAA